LFRACGIPDNSKSNYRLAEIRKMTCRFVVWWRQGMPEAALSKMRVAIQSLALAAPTLATTPLAAQDVSPPVEDIGAVLLIVGCFDDLSQCRELPPPVFIFETTAACDEQLSDSFGAFTGQFEQLYAQCLPVDAAMGNEDVELVWEVHADGTLFASIEAAPPPRIESTSTLVALAR
jgi:hypothetical protein